MLLGAVGGPQWSDPGARVRPEQGLLDLRRILGLFANLRPVRPLETLLDASPLYAEIAEKGLPDQVFLNRKPREAKVMGL